MSIQGPHLVLIVEDDPDDRLMFEEGIRQSGYKIDLKFVEDGDKLITYLLDEGNPKPNLLFVDLRLSEMDAHEVISFMKSNPRLDEIPVLVFTGEEREKEIKKVYAASGKAYVIKPCSLQAWIGTLNQIFKYWFETVRLPHLN